MDTRPRGELSSRSLDEFASEGARAERSGADGVAVKVRAGDIVRWAAGEAHETVATSAFAAVVVEAPDLRLG